MPKSFRTKAGEFIYNYLEDRFQQVSNGTLDPTNIMDLMGQRGAFYETQGMFKRKYPDLPGFDLKHKSPTELHIAFLKVIKYYCTTKMTALTKADLPSTIDSDVLRYWGIMRAKGTCIMAKERALAYGYSGEFPVLEKNRAKLRDEAFILLICEKEDVGLKVQYMLAQAGYVVNVVIAEGYAPCEIIETILEIADLDDNFYIFILHDYDASGFDIFRNIYDYFPTKTFSAGLNPTMLSEITTDITTFKEQYSPKPSIFKTLQNHPITNQWLTESPFDLKRERIDLIEALIVPILQYIKLLIKKHCKLWNLNRVTTPEAKEPAGLSNLQYSTYLWNTIRDHSIGYGFDWTRVAKPCQEEFIRQNKKYRRDITQYQVEVDLQAQVLQKIVDEDKPTQQTFKFVKQKITNVMQFLEKYYWEKVEFAEDFLYLFRFCFSKQK